jgi:hypothetical protein
MPLLHLLYALRPRLPRRGPARPQRAGSAAPTLGCCLGPRRGLQVTPEVDATRRHTLGRQGLAPARPVRPVEAKRHALARGAKRILGPPLSDPPGEGGGPKS